MLTDLISWAKIVCFYCRLNSSSISFNVCNVEVVVSSSIIRRLHLRFSFLLSSFWTVPDHSWKILIFNQFWRYLLIVPELLISFSLDNMRIQAFERFDWPTSYPLAYFCESGIISELARTDWFPQDILCFRESFFLLLDL